MSFTVCFSTSKGLGRHESDIPPAWHEPLFVTEYIAIVLYNPALMAVKSSILVFFIRISRQTQNFLRVSSYMTLAVVNVGGVVLTFITAFQCQPVQAAYSTAFKTASCISIEAIYLASAPVNVATDLAILLLPIPVLTSIRLPWQQKIILVMTFLLGIFVTITDIVRIYYVQLAAVSLGTLTRVSITSSLELSYHISFALLWSAIEVNVGIICACIPYMRPLVRLLVPSMALDRATRSDSRQRPAVAGTTQDMAPGAIVEPAQTLFQQTECSVYLGFIKMQRPKCMLDTRGMESVKYCSWVLTLFFLWGFSYGLLTSLNSVISVAGIKNPYQVISIPGANFCGYIFAPFLALWILHYYGFKTTFVTSLGIYCIGALMFYPSGALRSYPGFMVSNFVVGFSQSMLQISSNSFLTLCGPPQYAEIRLLLAESVATLATLLSSLLSQKVFFVRLLHNPSLIAVQWTYVAVALFSVLLALLFHYMPLPEASDSDLQRQAESLGMQPSKKYSDRLPVIFVTLAMAVLSAVFLSGAGQSINTFFPNLLSSVSVITATTQCLSTADFYLVGAATYVVSELIFALLCRIIPPRALLLLAYMGATTITALTMGLNLTSVNSTAAVVLVFVIFEAPIFPLTFAIGLRRLGKWTKLGACLITTGNGVGALVFPFVMSAVMQARTSRYSFCVAVALYAAGSLFPLYLNLFRAARHQVDPPGLFTTTLQRPDCSRHEEYIGDVGGNAEEIIPASP